LIWISHWIPWTHNSFHVVSAVAQEMLLLTNNVSVKIRREI
jgi:hypothetical protein